MRSTKDVLDHHVKCFFESDLEGILSDYAPDASSSHRTERSREPTASGPFTGRCSRSGTDTLVVRDGKILAQSFAGKITPKR